MHQNNRQHFLLYNLVKNEAESQAVFAVSYVRNIRGRAMLLDSTVTKIATITIHLTKFPTLPVIFSIYLKTDVLDVFEILWLSRTINLQNPFQFSVKSARKICRYSILIILGVILKIAKNEKNTMCGGKG